MWNWTKWLSSFACALILQVMLSHPLGLACQGDEMPRDMVLNWLKRRILEGLGMNEPPLPVPHQVVDRDFHYAAPRMTRETRVERRRHRQESSQIILFPSFDSTCMDMPDHSSDAASGHFTYYFQPSLDSQDSVITSAHFWFYAGEAIAFSNTSAPLFILTAHQKLLQASEDPVKRSPDGWTTYRLDRHLHNVMADGPFMLQVRCPACSCYGSEEAKTPFLHLHARPSGPDRSRRAPKIAWSPAAIEKLSRPAPDDTGTDCRKEQIEISFVDLGWDNWIVHPKAFTFYYCHGNCSSSERITTLLGMSQCCAPVPESMKSLRFTTTSDGGYSFKYETLPNIIPEECSCI
ncbi:inhibin alpha chain [Xyrauchen texanus]|uniref:inhibin alpha chain n=1 Tax=Xyrauchen texanus TaxID=154827 RepID=UPI002241FB87|nr:inhibin alpha chain [Xyrauchen texanus]